jgi:hypothetical protein
MRRIIIVFIVAMVGFMSVMAGVRDDFKANPKLSANNYQAYPDKNLPAITPAPEGYEPFFINHYGRHGSRWLINGKKYSWPVELLDAAQREGKLTRRGEEVLNILRKVNEASQGRLGELSDIGHLQHQGIARRMYQNFPQVFHDGAPVLARSTVVIRCILSMQNEVDVLASLNPRLKITTDASQSTMYYMNYSDSVVKPLREAMAPTLKKYREKWVNPKGMLKKLFNDQRWVKAHLNDDDARSMMIGLFDVVGNMQSHLMTKDINLYDLFSADDIYNVWRYNNAYWYILSGETPLTQCRVDYMEANLLRNFIQDADRAITGDNHWPGASLRFGHESVVLPLCCLMGLNGLDYRTTDLETLDQHWQTYKVFPMAANIQFVYFRKAGSDDILMLPLLNEREATLPVNTDVAPYYHWSDVRDYFIDKLSRQPIIDPNK